MNPSVNSHQTLSIVQHIRWSGRVFIFPVGVFLFLWVLSYSLCLWHSSCLWNFPSLTRMSENIFISLVFCIFYFLDFVSSFFLFTLQFFWSVSFRHFLKRMKESPRPCLSKNDIYTTYNYLTVWLTQNFGWKSHTLRIVYSLFTVVQPVGRCGSICSLVS